MSMRSALPYVLALVLGVSAAVLAACGSSSDDRKEFIPQRSADRLSSALSDVRSAVDDGDCEAAASAIARARGVLVNLPSAVNDDLVTRLRQGLDNLEEVAPQECEQQDTQTQTQETTTTTAPEETTPEETTATETTPTDTTTTETTPPDTTTTAPPDTTTTAPPDTTTAEPPVDPSGGTTTP
jgi:cell division protein FtsN